MTYEYFWDPGAPLQSELKKIDPEEFDKAIGDAPTAKKLANEAKAKDHIAHDFIYHVGVRKAAALHYEDRARLLLRAHRITVVDEPSITVRARIAISPLHDDGGDDDGDRYLRAQEVSAREDLRDIHRLSLLRRMNNLRQELISFDEFTEVVMAINHVLDREEAV